MRVELRAPQVRVAEIPYTDQSMRVPGSGAGKSFARRGLEGALRSAFMKAYATVKVDPDKYLEHLRIAYDLPALSSDGMYSVNVEVLDIIADETIRSSMRIAAAEGAGLGMGGLFTILPDLGILAAGLDHGAQRRRQVVGQCIADFRPVQRDDGDAVADHAEQFVGAGVDFGLGSHGSPSFFVFDIASAAKQSSLFARLWMASLRSQ